MKKLLASLIITMLMLMLVSTVGADVNEDDTVTSKATVVGGGSPPGMKHMWILPDDQPLTGSGENATQVSPVTCDQGDAGRLGKKDIMTWMVVTDPNGISDIANVHVKKFYPNATEKDEADATDVTGDSSDISTALAAAESADLLTSAEVADILHEITQEDAKVYKFNNTLDCHDPPGDYIVKARVTDKSGEFSEHDRKFEFLSVKSFGIDFFTSGIDYGSVKVLTKDWAQGDNNWDPDDSDSPTVKNMGNVDVTLGVYGTDMINQDNSNYRIPIDELDARFSGEVIDPLDYAVQYFTSDTMKVCTPMKIDFSILVPEGTPIGDYVGSITLVII